MQSKFEIIQDQYLSDRIKLVFTKNRIGRKMSEQLQTGPELNSINFFITINKILNILEDIFSNSYQKKKVQEKISELKMGTN